jgi:cytochrome c55X
MVAATLLLWAALSAPADPAEQRRDELVGLVREDCGSCHGLTLKGGLGPALLPETIAGKPDEFLTGVILDGVEGTPMPGWRPFLTPAEAAWIVQELKRGFPDER